MVDKMDMINQEEQTIETYDKYAESWAKDHPIDDYQTIIEQLKALAPQGSMLEIGCGAGQDAELLKAAGYDYLGVDASTGMVQLARSKHPNVNFMHLNLYDLAQLRREFDAFWCNAVLLHIPKSRINEALQAISSVIRLGGIGFVSIKDGDKEEFEERVQSNREEKRLFVHWRKEEFEEVLRRNGFKVVYYEYVPKSERSKWHRFVVCKQTP
jgi:SAM-dependent methyltransferase